MTRTGGLVPAASAPAVPSPELRAFYSESWFTAEGARLKYRRLLQAGIPDMRNWRFITLTVGVRGISPAQAYVKAKDRIRRFLARLRQAICPLVEVQGPVLPDQKRPRVRGQFLWCWKLETHEDDFPHWHLCVEYTKRIPLEMLSELEAWWGLGRVDVKRINRAEMFYVFKYVCKAAEDLPEWMQRHKGRLRVFQASKGFYTRRKQRVARDAEALWCERPITIAERAEWDSRRAILTTWHQGEKRHAAVRLRMTFAQLLLARALQAIARGVPLAASDSVTISQRQELELRYENRKWSCLAFIPRHAESAWHSASDRGPVPVGDGDLCPA